MAPESCFSEGPIIDLLRNTCRWREARSDTLAPDGPRELLVRAQTLRNGGSDVRSPHSEHWEVGSNGISQEICCSCFCLGCSMAGGRRTLEVPARNFDVAVQAGLCQEDTPGGHKSLPRPQAKPRLEDARELPWPRGRARVHNPRGRKTTLPTGMITLSL